MNNFNLKKNIIFNSNLEIQNFFGSNNIFLEDDSSLELKGSINIGRNISFKGNCVLEKNVHINDGSIINNTYIGEGSIIRPYSLLNNSNIGKKNIIGPFCFMRDDTNIGNDCIVGSYVEIARSKLGNKIKISHQSYIGDAFIEDNSIIGAGAVFCNFDGFGHQKSFIGKNVIIGSGTMIISPITIGQNSLIAAGSVITNDIKENSKIIQKR